MASNVAIQAGESGTGDGRAPLVTSSDWLASFELTQPIWLDADYPVSMKPQGRGDGGHLKPQVRA